MFLFEASCFCDSVHVEVLRFRLFSQGTLPKGARRSAPKARAAFSGRGPTLAIREESGKSRGPQSAGRSYGAEAVPGRRGRNGVANTGTTFLES